MKRAVILFVLACGGMGVWASLLEVTAEAERVIDARYPTERSHKMALRRLDGILNDEKLPDAEKEKRIRAEFLSVRMTELTDANAADVLLYTPVLSWRIHSLAIAYDVEGRFESIVSRERFADTASTSTTSGAAERTNTKSGTDTSEISGAVGGEAGLGFGYIPKVSFSIEGKAAFTKASNSASARSSAWSRQDQKALSTRYENVVKELSKTQRSGLHLRFVVEFTNNGGKDLVVPEGSIVPVYAGTAFGVNARMVSSVDLNIPAGGTVDIVFRGDLTTTAARALVAFMRTGAPSILPERSPLLVIRSMDGTIRNAVNDAKKVACTRIVCGAYSWNVRRVWNGKPVTFRLALGAINARYGTPPFTWEGTRLVTLCGAPCESFDLKRMPCVEINGLVSIGLPDASRPLPEGEVYLGLADASDFVKKDGKWESLSSSGREILLKRVKDLEHDAFAQRLLGLMYSNGYGVEKSDAEAVKWYRKSAEQGDEKAQFNLGSMYQYGRGVEKSDGEAVKWYRKSAEQGNDYGQQGLGSMYQYGRGVEKSYTEAVKWYRKSAEQGNAYGQFRLGCMYETGHGVEKSDGEAVKWFRKAAEQGNVYGQFRLGCMYEAGHGVEKSDGEAVKWFRKAAEQGNAYAWCNLGFMYENGRGVEKSAVEAVKWYRRAAEQGNADGQCSLGSMYADGCGVEKSDVEAVKWYCKSAEQGNARAQLLFGLMYMDGRGVEKSYTEAVKWYRKAAEQGNAVAQNCLGCMYANGHGVEKSDSEAVNWFRKSAEQGNATAQYNLGYAYLNGCGVEKFDVEAVTWWRKAAEQGEASAQCWLGSMYLKGNGIEKSDVEAVKWYRKSAEQGNSFAQHNLGLMYANGTGIEKSTVEAVRWFREAERNGYKLSDDERSFVAEHER